jgi:hypothetical protein
LIRSPVPILSTACALAAALSLGVTSSRADTFLPTLYVRYAMNCTFTITNDAGAQITQIAPGEYQLFISTPVPFGLIDLSGISDMTACKGFVLFSITGPGVNVDTNLEFGDNETDNSLQPTFLPGSTYVAQDGNQPTVARKAFTTAASGSSTPVSSSSSSSSSSSTGKGAVQKQLVGSAVVPFRGALAAAVGATGSLTLRTKGKPVGTLEAGLYTFTVHDNSATSGFSIQRLKASPTTLTGVGYKGTHVKTVNLKAGQWTFFTPSRKKNYFIVVNG